ncbi:LamG domain-containing protein [Halioglobus maricola]|uniref:LamG domain-containing protein n=1 Tax=Halioglobus maricola TaxID=2601894 RepID=A0A5P9NKX2_9GAMM|nr:LamG-like jellyroll fold domain-containing protein [Halioglobus maricola]QFU76259.1 LamG domain-containing protein [Halioglobus maricola]
MKVKTIFGMVFLGLLMATNVSGQSYSPDVYEFKGANGLEFDPSVMYEMTSGGTIEFWVAADWNDDPGYDPALIVNAGPDGANYLIAISRERDGLILASGEQEDVAAFNFADNKLHHVAIRFFPDEGQDVLIDGRFVAAMELDIASVATSGFWLGTIDGEGNPFYGAIAGLRIWDAVLTQEMLVNNVMQDVFAAEHPELANLLAISDFNTSELLLAE